MLKKMWFRNLVVCNLNNSSNVLNFLCVMDDPTICYIKMGIGFASEDIFGIL